MKLVSISQSEVKEFGKSARFIDGMGPVVDLRCMKRRIRKSVRRAMRELLAEDRRSRTSPPREST